MAWEDDGSENGDSRGDEGSKDDEIKKLRDINQRLVKEKEELMTASSSDNSDLVVPMKLDRGQDRLLHTFVGMNGWSKVKFVPKGDDVFISLVPSLLPALYDYMGIATVSRKQKYKAAILKAYREEVSIKRSNVKSAVREKYKSK